MPKGGGGSYAYDYDYDYDDDYDDGYDDDYYDDDDYDDAPAPPPKAPAKSKAAAPSNKKPGAAGGGGGGAGSSMAQGMKGKAGSRAPSGASYPVAPAPKIGTAAHFDFSSPSPDDVVQAAQAQKAKGPAIGGAAPRPTPISPAEELGSLSLGGGTAAGPGGVPSLPKKPADAPVRALSEFAPDEKALSLAVEAGSSGVGGGLERIHLVVLGHVDAGKSTMMGRLLHLLGAVDDKQVHKNERAAKEMGKGSFSWAWLLDERESERARGVTVDVAMGHFTTPSRSVTLLDAPGHRDFVPNMIAGASQADAAVLVVDASPGGFEAGFTEPKPGLLGQGGGQTREHAQLARSLGVEQLAVAVNKLDAVEYSQARFEEIRAQLGPFLRTCGFKEGKIMWLPVSGWEGENLTAPAQDPRLVGWWGAGAPCLVDVIDAFQPPARSLRMPARLPVAEVTKSRTLGQAAVGGKLEAGVLVPGQRVLVMPGGAECTVKAVERGGAGGAAVAGAQAGDSVDVGLVGVEMSALCAGMVLCDPGWPVPVVHRFEAQVVVLDVQVPILRGAQAVLHAHTAREPAKVSGLLATLDPKSGEVAKSKPRCLLKGQTALVEITPARAICAELYADYRALGRITLRDGSHTVAVGIITKLLPPT